MVWGDAKKPNSGSFKGSAKFSNDRRSSDRGSFGKDRNSFNKDGFKKRTAPKAKPRVFGPDGIKDL